MVATHERNEHSHGRIRDCENGPSRLSVPDTAHLVSVYSEIAYLTRYLDDEALTLQLKSLVEESAKPFNARETCFAAAGTVFGQDRATRRGWGLQCHLACGVETGVVVAVEAGGPTAHGVRLLPALLRTIKSNFPLAEELCASRPYLSKAGFEVAAELGLKLYIPFRMNSKFSHLEGRQHRAWDEALDLYRHRYEEFLRRYRRHSVVEGVLNAIRDKAGVWSCAGTDTAQLNALLVKVAAHNLNVVAGATRGQ